MLLYCHHATAQADAFGSRGPVEVAGVAKGDVIVALNGKPVLSYAAFMVSQTNGQRAFHSWRSILSVPAMFTPQAAAHLHLHSCSHHLRVFSRIPFLFLLLPQADVARRPNFTIDVFTPIPVSGALCLFQTVPGEHIDSPPRVYARDRASHVSGVSTSTHRNWTR